MKTERRKAEILYRTKKYGTWCPASITIPDDVIDIKEFVKDDLKNVGIVAVQIDIKRVR